MSINAGDQVRPKYSKAYWNLKKVLVTVTSKDRDRQGREVLCVRASHPTGEVVETRIRSELLEHATQFGVNKGV